MSKEYYTSDGSRVTVSDDGMVFGPNGYMGQVNQFGDFVSENNYYNINNYGDITSSDGTYVGKIANGNELRLENNRQATSTSYSGSSGGLHIKSPWKKLLFIAAVGLVSQIFLGIGIGISFVSPILFGEMVFFQENQTNIYIIVGIVMFLLWLKTVRFLKKLFF